MSFKLLAIRPLEGCDKEFLKVLKPNEFYTFYNDFKFKPTSTENEIEVEYINTMPCDFFNDNVNNSINISAIVGKNGSGKSSLIELLYAVIYNLSVSKGIIKPDIIDRNKSSFDIKSLINLNNKLDEKKPTKETLENLRKDLDILNSYKSYLESKFEKQEREKIELINNINVQIFFTINTGVIYVINSIDKKIKINKIEKVKGFESKYAVKINENTKDCFNELKKHNQLFYSIVNNYSLYGLNSNEIGDWIAKIFHKNDGYQTPIAINPMRTEGKIDINIENDLSKSRLLTNVLKYIENVDDVKDSFRCLVKDKIATKLVLKLKTNKFKNEREEFEFKNYELYKDRYLLNILNSFKSNEHEKDISLEEFNGKIINQDIVDLVTIEYIFRKIIKIAKTYPIGKNDYREKFNLENKYVVYDFIENLKTLNSHITFKLRQAINFFKFRTNYMSIEMLTEKNNYEVNVSIEILSREIDEKIKELTKSYSENKSFITGNGKKAIIKPQTLSLINFIPPSIFDIDIEFENEMGRFSSLSSGEKQNIYSINTILYHIVNIESIHFSQGSIEYKDINIVFDEIELYFHPEMQRTFIKDLLDKLQSIRTKNIYINILFITHSPFILSDIPKQNILFLKTEDENIIIEDETKTNYFAKPQSIANKKSFGANITDLLADSFYIGDGLIGAFAKNKINDVIDFLNKKESKIKTKENAKQIIEIIDEPLVKYKLKEMYFKKYVDTDYIDAEIERLNNLKARSNDKY